MRRLGPSLLLCAQLGCAASASSRDIRTSALVALVDVTSEQARQAVVSANVVVGGAHSNAYVELEDGDRLVASCEGEPRDMTSTGNGSYQARFARDDGEFVVGLMRAGHRSAPHSVGRLPTAFAITSDLGAKPFSRANDAMTLSWSPGGSDADVTIEIEGDCIRSAELHAGRDAGRFVIEPGKLTTWKNQEKQACNVVLRVVQTRKGQPDPALDPNSSVVLRQIRTIRFVSRP